MCCMPIYLEEMPVVRIVDYSLADPNPSELIWYAIGALMIAHVTVIYQHVINTQYNHIFPHLRLPHCDIGSRSISGLIQYSVAQF